ncbi:MAG: 3-deoxy-D-manno-octulosonic acid transferase [Candidatus Rokubacteria bacterium]|nr:3-deoxy-D-manno-octulosonic acid transferase [Candidatus Rokubacteria bacterium]
MIYGIYTAVATAALVAGYAPRALTRRLVHGVPLNLGARLGLGTDGRPATRSGWIHAVSVGEAITAGPLVGGLRRLHPELPLVLTTTTETGAGVVRARYGADVTHRFFPFDLPGAVRRTVDAIDPAFVVLMETELWPNLLRHLRARRIPVMIANGRLSNRSFPRYRLARSLLRPVLECVTVFAMQSDEDARRMIALGAAPERVVVTGNLKHEPTPDLAGSVELWQRLLGFRGGDRVWIAGSTHAGEEEAVLAAHAAALARVPGLTLVIAPRHPERVPEVLGLVATHGWPAVRRSELPRARVDGAVIVLDTVGELAQLYAVADLVFVGGSLVPVGGHNVFEAALRKKPVLFGPHTANFRDAAALMLASGGGVCVADAEQLAAAVRVLLDDADRAARMGQAGYEAVAARHGAVKETLELVGRFLLRAEAP